MELYSSCNELKGPNWKTSFLVVTFSPLWDIFGHGQPGHFSARSWRKSWKTRFMSSVASWIVPWGSQLMNSEDGNDGNEKFTTPVPSSCGVLTSDFCWHWLISQVRWGEVEVKKMQSLTQAQEFGAKKSLASAAAAGVQLGSRTSCRSLRLRRLPLKTFGPKGCCPVLNVDCVAWVPGGKPNDNPSP